MQKRILKYLAQGVAAAEKRFDPKTGRFLADNGGWAVTNQDIIFPLALLYMTPGTRHHGSDRVLDLCLRGGTALRNWQYPDGSFEFIKTDGSRWGLIYMPWSIYHWCETYALLREQMCARRRQRWAEGLRLAYDGVARVVGKPIGHNIAAWHGMSLVRGGQVFERDDWLRTGTRQVLHNARDQHPDGFWSEGDGPSTGYNLVYVHALGLYHAFTGDRAVLPALRRATEFHSTFSYPDGSPVETVDGRQRYHASVPTTGWPGFLLFPEGRALVSLWLEQVLGRGRGGLAPHLASVCQHFGGKLEAPRAQDANRRVAYKSRALVRRSMPWFLCVSGYVPKLASRAGLSRNRWILSRANCLSVWHDKLGLVIGGGNSKHDPFFATFEVWADGALRLEPDKVRFTSRGGRETARFRYGGLECLLHLKPSGKRLEITFELPAATARRAQVQAGFTMRLPTGGKLRWRKASTTLDPMRTVGVRWRDKDKASARVVRAKGWSLAMPADSVFEYPAYPFNPYAINDAAPTDYAVAAVSAGFREGRKRTFVLNIK